MFCRPRIVKKLYMSFKNSFVTNRKNKHHCTTKKSKIRGKNIIQMNQLFVNRIYSMNAICI